MAKLLTKRKSDGRKNNGQNFKGNSIEQGVHPNVLATRQAFSLGIPQKAKRTKRALSAATEEILDQVVIIDGVETNLTVAQQIIKQRALEAMQPNEFNGTAHAATQMLWDRSEGRPIHKTEVSGPEGGPIETVDTHVVLAKLFS